MFTYIDIRSFVSKRLKTFQTNIKASDIIKNSEANVITVWFFVFFGLFVLAMSYFYLYPGVHEVLKEMGNASCLDGCSLAGGQQSIIALDNRVDIYWRFAHVMMAVGLILYGILRSVRKEFDTYRQY
jgi:hypothetical protein